MQRIVSEPAGRRWVVGIEWVGRRLSWSRLVGRLSRRRERRKPPSRRDRSSDWLEYLDLEPGCFDEVPAIALIVVAVILLVWLGPGIIALALGIGEVLWLALIAGGVLVWRTVMRKPWQVIASDGQVVHSWSATGYLRARRIVRDVAASIESGRGAVSFEHPRDQ